MNKMKRSDRLKKNTSIMDEYQAVIHRSRYARYLPEEGRRETWGETIDRYISFFKNHISETLGKKKAASTIEWEAIREAIYNLDVMPSMRAMMTAGPALARDNVAGYNCSYLPIDNPKCFDEAMYILMCGTGVGFSVERQYVNKLPEVPDELHESDTTIVVSDSKIGWASAYRELIGLLYHGKIPKWDLGRLRPSGSPLRTMGGRASGPEPLEDLFKFTIKTFRGAVGRKLTSLECHDIMCKVGDIVVVGGVRRSALISLSNLTDERMRQAKSGEWWVSNGQRALANNSVCYTEKPDMGIFMREWESLYASKSGERGIFNRVASQEQAAKNGRRDATYDFGTNPCSEIILRPYQFCNLTEVVIRATDTVDTLKHKVRIASILGTIQATLTDFRYLSKKWKDNTEEERLLGVSLTGICDSDLTSDIYYELDDTLADLKEVAITSNKELAKLLGIPQSAAITCVKPSGTVSQLVGSASGIHPRYDRYYIRRVRFDKKDPMASFMIAKGFPHEEDFYNKSAWVFSFPMESPESSLLRQNITAEDQLELWRVYQEWWCEHKPSITVYVREHEWLDVGAWVYRNFNLISGVSFLPYDTGTYRQAPYESIDKGTYESLVAAMPQGVDWTEMLEVEDTTTGTKELACTAGVCEI
jgi:ribonucleoside-diphosphate reductase alpha chain